MATKKAAKKASKKSAGRKYDPSAGKDVEREMKAMKKGELKSGAQRQEGDEPQTGDCDRTIRGAEKKGRRFLRRRRSNGARANLLIL